MHDCGIGRKYQFSYIAYEISLLITIIWYNKLSDPEILSIIYTILRIYEETYRAQFLGELFNLFVTQYKMTIRT
jgi:hypothetical protein